MSDENIQFVVSLRGGSESAAEVRKVKEAITEAGGATRTLGAESHSAAGGASSLTGGLKRLAVGLLAVGAGYKIYNAAKGAISYTKELAESSNALTKATGLTIEESSRYVGVAGALGVSSSQLNMSFKALATQTEKQATKTHASTDTSGKHRLAVIAQELALGNLEKRMAKGTITQAEYRLELEKLKLNASKTAAVLAPTKTAFDKLGITQEWVTKHGKNFNEVILEVTKRLNEMKGSPEKTKIETELFGRSWATLNPLLGEGAAHLEHVLDISKKFGVELHGGVNKELEELREAQLESTLASDGLRIAFTKTAAGPMINLLKGFAQLKLAAGKGEWGKFNQGLSKAMTVGGHIIETFEVRAAEGFGQLAPKLVTALWNGFKQASLPNKALMAGLIFSKLGLTDNVFSGLGKVLGQRVAAGAVAESAAVSGAGVTLGAVFGVAILGAAAGYLLSKGFPNGLFGKPEPTKKHAEGTLAGQGKGTYLRKNLDGKYEVAPKRGFGHTEAGAVGGVRQHAEAGAVGGPHGKPTPAPKGKEIVVTDSHGRTYYLNPGEKVPGMAFGGSVRRGGMVEVGEHGRELLNLPTGASVTPLAPGSMRDERPMYLQVDGRVLARVLRRQDLLSQASGA